MFSWEALEGIAVGGGAAYASRLAAALAEAGHQVKLFTRLGQNQALRETVGKVEIHRCPWDARKSFFEEIAALAGSFEHYYREVIASDGPPDIIHCHEWLTIEAGLRALEANPARFAVSFHSTEWSRTGIWPDSGDSARISGIERSGVEKADAIIAASFQARRKIEQQFHPPDWKCEVVYHGVDLEGFDKLDPAAGKRARERLHIDPAAMMILFAGRFSPQSGADLAAETAGIVSSRQPGTRFVFIGSGRLEHDMRRLAGQDALFVPPQGRTVGPELYLASDLALATFRRDPNGRAVLPAWAAGKPVIALSGTVPSEFLLDGINGLVAQDNAELLARSIISLLHDPDQMRWMGRNGRVAAETAFTWAESAKRLLRAYNRRSTLTP